MGLDMFLYKEIDSETEDLFYWRKANQIRSFFVNCAKEKGIVLDNSKYEVTTDDLTKLKELIIKVLDSPSDAEKYLPAQEGFFFGTYDYDEYYFHILEETLKNLDEWIHLCEKGEKIIYYEWY